MKRNKSFEKTEPIYFISSPIGNLKDVSTRTLEVLNSLDIIACEDTRNTGKLLSYFKIKKELISLREHNEVETSNYLINLEKQGKKIGYLSDAGYPCISDPGAIFVQKIIEENLKISVIPGPSAFLSALVGSSLPTNHFYFHGFLSPKLNERKEELNQLKNKKETLIFYEAPHRIKETLTTLFEVLGNRKATIAREITKINEEYIYGTLEELLQIDENTLIGEMAIVVEGNSNNISVDDKEISQRVKFFISKGLSHKDACEVVAEEFKIKKNYVYNLTK